MIGRFDRGTTAQYIGARGELPLPVRADTGDRIELADEHLAVVDDVHNLLLQQIDLPALADLPSYEARAAVEQVARGLVNDAHPRWTAVERDAVLYRVIDEVLGLGPIEQMVQDQNISEIMVNDFDEIYYEQDGIIYESPIRFRDRAHVMRIIDRITSSVGRRVDESSPMVDARLADGSRVNAAIPPVIPRGPVLTIRKFRRDRYALESLVENATLSRRVADFLIECVRLRLNVLVSGGTGSGKTTFLNALSEAIPERERIVTIEDPTELRLQQKHVIAMEARPANIEGSNAISQRELFRNSLRMRPDRIIVGEVRGPEAFEMMQAMNTGHDGSLTTVHANSPRDALFRIENMVLMSGYELPVYAIREQIASAIHLVIHISRLRDGSRRITHISEITGREGDVVTMQDIFVFEMHGLSDDGRVLGALVPTGLLPTFAERFSMMGVDFSSYIVPEAVDGWKR